MQRLSLREILSFMLQVNVLRQKTDWVKGRLGVKNFKQTELVDEIIALDDERKKLQAEFDALQAKVNASSKNIGKLMAAGNKEEAEQLKADVANWKASLEPVKKQASETEKQLEETLVLLPNLPSETVPRGFTAEDNEVVKESEKPLLSNDALPHWELTKKYKLIDFDLGTKITGSGFPVYMGKGAKLQRTSLP